MQTTTQTIIKERILPECKMPQSVSNQFLEKIIEQTRNEMSQLQFEAHLEQWNLLGKKLNTSDKMLYLRQDNFRVLIIQMIKNDAMSLFNASYLNRAKIDTEMVKYIKQLGVHFFIEVIRIVSKLKIIHKHFYAKMSQSPLESHIMIKILRILQLCNQTKRSINNNKDKFLCIVQEQNDRVQITKELGKMLRESWKRDKAKDNTTTTLQEQSAQIPQVAAELSPCQIPKEYVKSFSGIFINDSKGYDCLDEIESIERGFRGSQNQDSIDFFLE